MIVDYEDLSKKIDYLSVQQRQVVYEAYEFAKDAHKDQKRISGEPYITHPISVAMILADLKLDYQSIVSGLLHDVIEDTPITKEEIKTHFGQVVANLVDGLSKLMNFSFSSKQDAQANNFRKMLLAMSQDIRVIIIKLADRLHNMKTITSLRRDKQVRIASETLEIYAPIAKRLGMHDIALELEDLGFSSCHPIRYQVIKDALKKVQGEHRQILNEIKNALQQKMVKDQVAFSTIMGREKHIYSIYRKMKSKRLSFSELTDVLGFRILLDNKDSCYRALGVVHSLYKPISSRFKDYISLPKPNGYQSLHTVLFGPHGMPMEVQLRTEEMDNMANYGIAAHWLYKSGEIDTGDNVNRHAWLKDLIEVQQRTGSSQEFLENVKVDLFPEEVYVFTPQGDIIELPSSATVLDLAYAIHTDVGHQAVVAKVDRQFAPLSAELKNGQTVEIITSPNNHPTKTWMDIVVTGKAKSAIKYYLKSRQREASTILGMRILKKSFAEMGRDIESVRDEDWQIVVKKLGVGRREELLQEVALGVRQARSILELIPKGSAALVTPELGDTPLSITGTEGLVVEYGECCGPIPGDPIHGMLRTGHGVVIHRSQCPHLLKAIQNKVKIMPVSWAENVTGEYRVNVKVEAMNQRGVLAMMALAVSDAKANIDDIGIRDYTEQQAVVLLKLQVTDRKQLANVIRRLRRIKLVMRAEREPR